MDIPGHDPGLELPKPPSQEFALWRGSVANFATLVNKEGRRWQPRPFQSL